MRLILSMFMIVLALQGCSKKEESTSAPAAVQQQGNSYVPNNPQAAVKQSAQTKPAQVAVIGAVSTAQEPVLVEAKFTCKDGSAFTALFKQNKVDIVFPKYQPIVLSQDVTASGFQYSNAQYKLRGAGKEATWTAGRRVPVTCTSK